ncbi:MAG: hypothetical protein IJS01_15440 [Lentisphaeria bacterium]|nr:hypothetical protein [Lentisphaeria bacterium]
MSRISIVFLLLFSSVCYAQNPEKLEVGIYVNRIDSFDIKTGTASIDFWLWGRRSGSSKPILATLEISNGQIQKTGEIIKKQKGNIFYEAKRYSAIVACRVNLKKFPFDKQTIKICIEDNELLIDQMIFSADTKNSRIDPSWRLNEWNISPLRCFSDDHLYPTSFGDPDVNEADGSSRYSRLNVEMDLARNGDFLSKCFKYFWAIIVSAAVGLAALWIRVVDCDARFGMTVGALFANVGCSFIIADKLPDSPELTVAELVSYVSLGVILILLLESIISLWLYNHEKTAVSRRLDHWSFWTISAFYTVSVVGILWE